MKRKLLCLFTATGALLLLSLAAAFFLFAPTRSETFSNLVELPPPEAGFVLLSPNFADGGPIPARYTCDGEDIPPTLAWGKPPAGTKSLLLIVDDPDAPLGTWTHWIVYNIPPDVRTADALFTPGLQINEAPVLFGKNSWGRQTYGGPCPPSGTHRYVFQLFALDILLGPADKATRGELAARIPGHILGYAELTGTYSR